MNMIIYTLYRIINTEPIKFVFQPYPQIDDLVDAFYRDLKKIEYENIQIISDKQHRTDINSCYILSLK